MFSDGKTILCRQDTKINFEECLVLSLICFNFASEYYLNRYIQSNVSSINMFFPLSGPLFRFARYMLTQSILVSQKAEYPPSVC